MSTSAPPPALRPRPVRRLLALGPDASRGAATRSLLELVRWARAERAVEATVVLLDGGPLLGALAEVATVRVAPRLITAPLRLRAGATGAGALATGRDLWLRRALADADRADVVLATAAGLLPALRLLPAGAPPVVVQLHELADPAGAEAELVSPGWASLPGGRRATIGLSRRDLSGPEASSAVLGRAALVVVPSAEVAELVVRPLEAGGLGVSEGRVRHHLGPLAPPARHRPPARDDVALVAGCGPLTWAAGVDRFVALAAAVGPEVGGRAVHWIWLGEPAGDPAAEDAADEVALRGLGDRVHMTGDGGDGPDLLAAVDLLALTGRHDPWPLAAVDAALAGTPVVGFRPGTSLLAAAGQDDRRVDHLDVEALAAQVVDLLSSPDRARTVAAAQARAAARATTPLAAPDLWADVERAAAGGCER